MNRTDSCCSLVSVLIPKVDLHFLPEDKLSGHFYSELARYSVFFQGEKMCFVNVYILFVLLTATNKPYYMQT